jgi:hypothetical protein
LTTLTFADRSTVLTISPGVWYASPKLTTITFGTGVTVIPDQCFQDCVTLTTVVMSETISAIGNYTFKGMIFMTLL